MARAHNERLIQALGDLLENRTQYWLNRGGCSVSWDWIVDLFGGDEHLTRTVMLRNGYAPSKDSVGVWRHQRGGGHCLRSAIDDEPFREQVEELMKFYKS